ncbi:hypothetical protein ACSLVK_07275 [Photorhabdus tasmaniensis]|uniref:hypothetical protein n=1 Tax=Photorhabdus tasmaniensis TaxID=1004159 RepID=UPI0040437BD9
MRNWLIVRVTPTAVRDKYRQEYDKVQGRIATCSGVTVAKELRALQGEMTGTLRFRGMTG